MRDRKSILADTLISTPLQANRRIRHPASNNLSLLVDYFSLGDTNHVSHKSSHHFTLYLLHELPTDLMLRCYLRDTSPSPVKLLVMEVRIRNSELHLHPIVLTLTVIPPPLVQRGTMPLSKRELDQLVPAALRHVTLRGGALHAPEGRIYRPMPPIPRFPPDFPPRWLRRD